MASVEAVLAAPLGALTSRVNAWSGRAVTDLAGTLNRLAGTTGRECAGAANVWAGTTGRELVGALNAKAGTTGLEFNRVCKTLASQNGGDDTLDAQGALDSIP